MVCAGMPCSANVWLSLRSKKSSPLGVSYTLTPVNSPACCSVCATVEYRNPVRVACRDVVPRDAVIRNRLVIAAVEEFVPVGSPIHSDTGQLARSDNQTFAEH